MNVGDPSNVLRRAAELLSPTTWTQGVMARDIEGRLVPPTSSRAICWSAEGAIRYFSFNSVGTFILASIAAEIVLTNQFRVENARLDAWNDEPTRTVNEVKYVLMAAADRLDERAAFLNDRKFR